MSKNIVVYSDGTGQDGAARVDQRLSNVYKMFRATRVGPDSAIDPAAQVAFYDPGLGTDADSRSRGKVRRAIGKLMASVAGRGIAYNIVDCYEFILNHWRPGDRIFLVGFSRGAYTVRALAQVLALCGVPTHEPDAPETPLRRFSRSTRGIADLAVRRVYEHGAGHDREAFAGERNELARRFRDRHGSNGAGAAGSPNADPYFVGVFDTVAALGVKGPKRLAMISAYVVLVAVALLALTWAVSALAQQPFLSTFVVLAGVTSLIVGTYLRRDSRRFIDDYPGKGSPRRTHHIAWRSDNYDRELNVRVGYGRHATAIDEDRADFKREGWGRLGAVRHRRPGEPEPLVQLWFAGNHSDIGGSYPETESRLSDVTLQWMVDEAKSLPHPLVVDDARLRIWPDALGQQHSELQATRDRLSWLPDWVPTWLRDGWKPGLRRPSGYPVHPSVYQRFAARSIGGASGDAPYRPAALAGDQRFARRYASGSEVVGAAVPGYDEALDVEVVNGSTSDPLRFRTDDPISVTAVLQSMDTREATLFLPELGWGDYHDELAMRWVDRCASAVGIHSTRVTVASGMGRQDPAAARLLLGMADAVEELVRSLGYGATVRLRAGT